MNVREAKEKLNEKIQKAQDESVKTRLIVIVDDFASLYGDDEEVPKEVGVFLDSVLSFPFNNESLRNLQKSLYKSADVKQALKNGNTKKVLDGEEISKNISVVAAILGLIVAIFAIVGNKVFGLFTTDDGQFNYDEVGFIITCCSFVITILIFVIATICNRHYRKKCLEETGCNADDLLATKYENKQSRLLFHPNVKMTIKIREINNSARGNSGDGSIFGGTGNHISK